MNIIKRLRKEASQHNARIVLPEGHDPRMIQAAVTLAQQQIVQPILLGNPTEIEQIANEQGIELPDTVQLLQPEDAPQFERFAEEYYALRRSKGISQAEAKTAMTTPLNYGAMMVRLGEAEGCVAGAVHATSQVLRAALQIIGMAEGVKIASSVFLMVLPENNNQPSRAITYGDCGMVPDPDATQLAQIAIASAHTHTQLTGEEPAVAMLSFSTKGSAKHPTVDKVQEATALAQQMAPELLLDGELQFDAAYVAAIGEKKAPDSTVAGQANVFIFPNLDAGNIGYKITERLGGAQAIGPIIQGLAKPMHDLSRGCKADDIVTLAAICAVQTVSG